MKSFNMRSFFLGLFQRSPFLNQLFIATMFVVALPIVSHADSSLVTDPGFNDDPFELYFLQPCIDGPVALLNRDWSLEEIIEYTDAVCDVYFPAGSFITSEAGYQSTSNLGSKNAQSKSTNSTASQQTSSIKERLAELEEEANKSTDKAGWGLLLSAQQGETERVATNQESGFESDLDSLVIGGDYRFNGNLVVGFAVGNTTDEITFDGNTGLLETDSSALTVYFTYIPVDGAYIDGYIGQASLDFSSSREVIVAGDAINPVSFLGTITGKFDGDQDLLGVSGGYEWFINGLTIGPYAALDYNRTEIGGYDEQGTSNLELRYPDQVTHSKLFSIGINVGYNFAVGWGTLVPSFSMARVHESFDEARAFDVRLIVLPDIDTSTLQLSTDAPDKDYNLATLGLNAGLKNGTQIFASYEQIRAHDFIDTWALTLGVLVEF